MYNRKPLTNSQLREMNEVFRFELVESIDGRKFIHWGRKTFNRGSYHEIKNDSRGFYISYRTRKLKIDYVTICAWVDKYINEGKTLIDVQNAYSLAEITHNNLFNVNGSVNYDSLNEFMKNKEEGEK